MIPGRSVRANSTIPSPERSQTEKDGPKMTQLDRNAARYEISMSFSNPEERFRNWL